MKQLWIERRMLLKSGIGALLGLTSRQALAEVLMTGNDTATGGDDSVLAAQLRLGGELIRHFASQKGAGAKDDAKDGAKADEKDDTAGNVVVSPASLAAILSLIDLGGNHAMHSGVHRALGFRRATRRKANQDLAALRNSVSAIIGQSGKDGPLVLANLVALDRAINPKQLALYGLSGAGADVLVDNLQDAKVLDRINAWVKEKTHDLIPRIIDEPPQGLGLVGVNALYFKDKWQVQFAPSETKVQPFQTTSGKPVDVQMMHSGVAQFRFREDQRFVGAELGYANENFKLVVVTTRSTPAPAQDFAAVAGWLDGKDFVAQKGEVVLPRLTLSASKELLPPLDELGLAAARQSPDALEGFSDEALRISRIVQKIELHVNEEGTEGAAATAVMTTRGMALDQVRMVVDKPFVFALRDEKTGLILFMGYVAAPPKAEA